MPLVYGAFDQKLHARRIRPEGAGAELASLTRHRAADRIVQGTYWKGGRGCAVGCSIHDFAPGREEDHTAYEDLFGIPKSLARLEDALFERLPAGAARVWPERFVSAIRPGADLTRVVDQWLLWLLCDVASPLAPWRAEPWMATVAALYERRLADDEPTQDEWDAAGTAAGDAAGAAAGAALAAWQDAAWDAGAAAEDAARAAEDAGDAGDAGDAMGDALLVALQAAPPTQDHGDQP